VDLTWGIPWIELNENQERPGFKKFLKSEGDRGRFNFDSFWP
jgi:hypothetical protein